MMIFAGSPNEQPWWAARAHVAGSGEELDRAQASLCLFWWERIDEDVRA
jgi:hypothetical protein